MVFASFLRMVLSSPYILKSHYKFFTADNEQQQQITNEWMISCPPFLTSSSYQHGCEQNLSYGAGVCVFESIVSCPHEHVAAPHRTKLCSNGTTHISNAHTPCVRQCVAIATVNQWLLFACSRSCGDDV
jgi:hypothetical protein